MMQSVQNSKKTKKYIKFITTKNKGKKKKVVKEYYLKRVIV